MPFGARTWPPPLKVKKGYRTERRMTTGLFLLRCVEMGLSIRDATQLPWDGEHPVRRGFLIVLIYLALSYIVFGIFAMTEYIKRKKRGEPA